jgi:hypothetical protein
MGARNVQESSTIEAAVGQALVEAGIKDDSPIRQVLVHDSEVYDLVEVCVPSSIDGRSVSLAQRLAEMRAEPRWSSQFREKRPAAAAAGRPPTPVPPGATLMPTRDQFADIVSGKAVVR